ncbi:MAG: aldolase/citrate lyase family protein, partial [Chloroflexi bacterium]|nr:aldolase/citrate lyase family protein [Chloroflexota bacterium]
SPAGIENLDAMLKVPGIDAIFVGPNDLTIALGIPDQYDNPKYLDAVRRIIKTSKKHGVPTLVHHHNVEQTNQWLQEGARFVLHGSDARIIHNGMRAAFGEIKALGEKLSGQSSADIGDSDEVL